MKISSVLLLTFLLSTAAHSQCGEMSLGLSGSAIIPQQGKTGMGTNISFIYNLSEQFAVHHGIGILGWGSAPGNSSRIFMYSMAARYYLTNTKFQPYLSAELSYGIGKITDTFISEDYPPYKLDKKINEFMSGLGAGMRYPLTELLSIDLNYVLIMTVTSNELYHMRGSVGVLYRI